MRDCLWQPALTGRCAVCREFDANSGHYFYVDTKAKPPRSIWSHPLDVSGNTFPASASRCDITDSTSSIGRECSCGSMLNRNPNPESSFGESNRSPSISELTPKSPRSSPLLRLLPTKPAKAKSPTTTTGCTRPPRHRTLRLRLPLRLRARARTRSRRITEPSGAR